jgi:hypothetical protein
LKGSYIMKKALLAAAAALPLMLGASQAFAWGGGWDSDSGFANQLNAWEVKDGTTVLHQPRYNPNPLLPRGHAAPAKRAPRYEAPRHRAPLLPHRNRGGDRGLNGYGPDHDMHYFDYQMLNGGGG